MWRRPDRRQEWVNEMVHREVRVHSPVDHEVQIHTNERYEYVDFNVYDYMLSTTLTKWGQYGWHCHSQSPNKTALGVFDHTVWVLLERRVS